ncbi:uncharacterized protein K452DRAFT_139713 [Aplosporella prunicola CBS 121167]|uniref:Uncharacterized protein n=1 Tax=Aplosporella prunicola CBS 121167 TaxID=1176127 RepID=A0A6A6AX70_9PEZI|nr:uncharacterized protein K452DRAFT_139713 [Aplosporella prunicola CBS 121167]KAF2136206.1 hypothetical protein K452DRAFT_139713 [Aplosporella prunicola CBS 121167]
MGCSVPAKFKMSDSLKSERKDGQTKEGKTHMSRYYITAIVFWTNSLRPLRLVKENSRRKEGACVKILLHGAVARLGSGLLGFAILAWDVVHVCGKAATRQIMPRNKSSCFASAESFNDGHMSSFPFQPKLLQPGVSPSPTFGLLPWMAMPGASRPSMRSQALVKRPTWPGVS